MKEDAPPPPRPPRKRYQLESEQKVPTTWLHHWKADESLSERERALVSEELERRRQLQPDRPVGLVVDREGVTEKQREGIIELLASFRPTVIHHPGVTSRLHSACKGLGVPVEPHRDVRQPAGDLRGVVLASQIIIGAPRGLEDHHNRTPAWEAISYARHRKLQIAVVLPDGARL